jgi:hypothetical protein
MEFPATGFPPLNYGYIHVHACVYVLTAENTVSTGAYRSVVCLTCAGAAGNVAHVVWCWLIQSGLLTWSWDARSYAINFHSHSHLGFSHATTTTPLSHPNSFRRSFALQHRYRHRFFVLLRPSTALPTYLSRSFSLNLPFASSPILLRGEPASKPAVQSVDLSRDVGRTNLKSLPTQLLAETGGCLKKSDHGSLSESIHHLHSLYEKQLHSKLRYEEVERAVQADNVPVFRRFLECGLDINMEMSTGRPPLDFAMCESNRDHHEVLKVRLRQRGLHTDGFTLYTTEGLMDANIQYGMSTRVRRAGVSVEVVEDEQEAFPLLASDTWLGGVYYEEDRW